LPSLQWHLCCSQASIVIKLALLPCNNLVVAVIDAQASLLLPSWHCCPCHNGVAVIDAQVTSQSRPLCCCYNNVVSLVAMTSLPLSSWCCCPRHNGIVTIINVQASLLLSQWHHCPHCVGVIANIAQALAPMWHRHCCPDCADLFVLTLHRCPHHCCTSVVAPVELVCLQCCSGVIALVTLALLPLVRWH
jgi:hypothetical protein